MMILQTFLARRNDEDMNSLQKGGTSRRYGHSSERRNMLKIWTFLKKEEHVEDMNPPRTKGEQVDDMDPPWKGGVMIILPLMMGDSEAPVRLNMLTSSDIHLWTKNILS